MQLILDNVLIIEQSMRFRRLLLRFFAKNFPKTTVTEYPPKQSLPDDTFSWKKINLLILGYELGTDTNGLEWLKACKKNSDFPAIIFITEQAEHAVALKAIKYGAHNHLSKEKISITQLKNAVAHAMKKHAREVAIANTKSLSATQSLAPTESLTKNQSLAKKQLFSRANLYKKLDAIEEDGMIALIRINDHHSIYYKIGLLGLEPLIIHLAEDVSTASQSMKTGAIEIFKISDNTIAVITLDVKNVDVFTQFTKTLLQTIQNKPFVHNDNKIAYSISVGIAQIQKGTDGAKNNITNADIALRKAMHTYGNSFAVFGSDAESISNTDKILIAHIQNIIKNNRIRPFFQLMVSASEASQNLDETTYIMRTKIMHTNKKLLEYDDIFPLLVQGNLVREFDYCVIQYVMQKMQNIKKQTQKKTAFLVSLAEATLAEETIVKVIQKLVAHFQDSSLASSLILDIQAQHFKNHQENIIKIMQALRSSYKMKFSLTDIHNLDPLSLKTLATTFDFIKVSLNTESNTNNKKTSINKLLPIVEQAKIHGALTIADQLDNANYLTAAVQNGADFICGYIIHPPEETITSLK